MGDSDHSTLLRCTITRVASLPHTELRTLSCWPPYSPIPHEYVTGTPPPPIPPGCCRGMYLVIPALQGKYYCTPNAGLNLVHRKAPFTPPPPIPPGCCRGMYLVIPALQGKYYCTPNAGLNLVHRKAPFSYILTPCLV